MKAGTVCWYDGKKVIALADGCPPGPIREDDAAKALVTHVFYRPAYPKTLKEHRALLAGELVLTRLQEIESCVCFGEEPSELLLRVTYGYERSDIVESTISGARAIVGMHRGEGWCAVDCGKNNFMLSCRNRTASVDEARLALYALVGREVVSHEIYRGKDHCFSVS